MAILKGINGGSFSGSVGKVTFRKGLKGKIIASQKAESVSNPRTHAQQEQRMFMKTAVTAYSAMKEICNHSFEGVPFGQKSMAKFIELNVEQIRNYSTLQISGFTSRKNGSVAPQHYIVSKGSLRSITLEQNTDKTLALKVGNTKPTLTITQTWKPFSKIFGLKPGDQLEIIALLNDDEKIESWDEEFQPNIYFSYSRYVFAKNLQDDTKITTSSGIEFNEDLFSEKIEQNITLTPDEQENNNYILTTSSYIWCAAVIVSRKQGNKWLRSTAEMIINGTAAPAAYKYDNVLKSYNAARTKYLNNATD